MKSLLILLFLPLQLLSQDISGLWIGIIHNDVTNMDLHYEVVISEQDGKFSGYSYTNFIVDGRSLTGVKSITVNKRFGKFYIEDEQLVYNNYPEAPPSGVKQLSILEVSAEEELLTGRFTTSRTKQYGKPVTGHIHMLRKTDLAVSKLMEILNGLQLASSLSFVKVDLAKAAPPAQKTKESPKTEVPKPDPVIAVTKKPEKNVPAAVVKAKPEVAAAEKPAPPKVVPAPTIEQQLSLRKLDVVQTITFSSDSLELELYDNGYVDGDSVSVMVNGRAFLSNIRLSEKAERRMIRITPEMGDSLHVVLFALNLGSIAPNSGLAIIREGKIQHKIAFSGDLQKNAAILLRRKKTSAQ